VIDRLAVHDLIHKYWIGYDEYAFDAIEQLLTPDTVHRSRTDTGDHPFEEFIRSDVSGRDAVMAHVRAHRQGSPYPLRHNATNIYVVDERPDEIDVESYLFVTELADRRPVPLSSGICRITVRSTPAGLQISSLEVVLDFGATEPGPPNQRLRSSEERNQ
jgi:hypothetical protein